MKLNKIKALIAITAFTLPLSAQANLIQNGSFELTPTNLGNNSWTVYQSLPNWTLVSGAGIEVERGLNGGAQDGNKFIELDSHYFSGQSTTTHTNSRINQQLNLGPGSYELSFWYKPRTNTINDNIINVFINGGNPVFSVNQISSTQPNWTEFQVTFNVATMSTYDISFGAGGTQNTYGGFLDNVQLVQTVFPTPEPSVLMLMFGAIVSLFYVSRKIKA